MVDDTTQRRAWRRSDTKNSSVTILPCEYDSVPLPCVGGVGSRQISKESSISKPSSDNSRPVKDGVGRSIPIRGRNSVMMPPLLSRAATPIAAPQSHAQPRVQSRHQSPHSDSQNQFRSPIYQNTSPVYVSKHVSSAHASPIRAAPSSVPMMVNSQNYFVPSGYQAQPPRRYTPYVRFLC